MSRPRRRQRVEPSPHPTSSARPRQPRPTWHRTREVDNSVDLLLPDVKSAARYAADHGGKVVVPPRLLAGRGEIALLADPEGAPFGVIHSSSGDPPDYLAEDKQWVWIELWAKDPKAMAGFYSGLAGYELEPVERPDGRMSYYLASGGYTRCGFIPSPAPSTAPAWLPYLRPMASEGGGGRRR